jgi:hypothetical protein
VTFATEIVDSATGSLSKRSRTGRIVSRNLTCTTRVGWHSEDVKFCSLRETARRPMSSPDQILIDAARHYAKRTAGQGVQRIALTLADGSKRKLDVPLQAASDQGDEWPPESGWGYRGDEFACGPETFAASGKGAKILRALIDAGGGLVPLADLKKLVWDQWTDTRTVQNAVSKLRQVIRAGLGIADDVEVIDATDEGYRLLATE